MPEGVGASLTIRAVDSIARIGAETWDRCAGAGNPFVSHAFLSALEDSGSAAPEMGWQPHHLVLETADGAVLGVAPAYLKSHSYGEYVFDFAWAHALESAGGDYYPKLQGSVPFTPATGPRLLIAPDVDTVLASDAGGRDAARLLARQALLQGFAQLVQRHDLSSAHITFAEPDDVAAMRSAGWMVRTGIQYHWTNPGYADFEDFLAALSSRKRKAIRKERRQVADAGVRLRRLSGDDLTPAHWDSFFEFYLTTADRKWGMPYLNRAFFEALHQRLRDRVVLVMAEHDGEPVAGALNLAGADCLYGRNWGCAERFPFLHFEACYYQAIEHAIEHDLARVEAGAQGEHKIQRGYLPTLTYSGHWIGHPGLKAAVRRFLDQEGPAVEAECRALAAESPFRKEE